MADELLMRLELTCDERAPHVVRSSLSSLDGIAERVPDLVLISSEIVSNAVLHSGCRNGDRLGVSLARSEQGYRLSVIDPGLSDTSAGPVNPRPAGGGLGLRIVEALAARWGHSRGRGYQVWAEVAA